MMSHDGGIRSVVRNHKWRCTRNGQTMISVCLEKFDSGTK